MDYTLNYLDLWGVVVNEIIGSVLLAGLLFIAIIAFVGARFRMPGRLVLFMISIFIIFFASMYAGWYMFLYIGIAYFVGWIIYRMLHK